MLSILPQWLSPRQAVTSPKHRRGFRPSLEDLEGRCAPAVLAVNSAADNTAADGALTLREAIQLVDGTLGRTLSNAEKAQVIGTLGTSDTIRFDLPAGPQTITLTGDPLFITKAVALHGPGAGTLTVDGNGAGRVFYVSQGSSPGPGPAVSLSGLTIADGKDAFGAGLLNGATLTLTDVAFTNNTAAAGGGGGVYNTGVLSLIGCTFTDNTALPNGTSPVSGGALFNSTAGTVTATACTFAGNTAPGAGAAAGQGGALGNSGTLTLNGGSFTGNSAASDGGALYTRVTGANNRVVLVNVTFAGNTSGADGGAVRADAGCAVTVTGCTFVGNTASSEGGALDGSLAASLAVVNSTFTGNFAGSIGGALNCGGGGPVGLLNDTIAGNRVGAAYGGGVNIRSPGVALHNTIVAGNYQGSGTAPDDITGYNFSATPSVADPSSSYNLIGPGGSGGLVNGTNHNLVGVTSPGLGPLADNGGPTQTMALLPGSPAIDGGSNAFVTAGETDQRQLARIANGTVDIGAFEVQTFRPVWARLVTVKVGKNKKLAVEVLFADTGARKREFISPFQPPAFSNIRVSVRDTTGDGVPDHVVVRARKGKRTVAAVFPA